MDWLAVFQWLEASSLGNYVRQSLWLFPVIEAFHLVALAAIGGSLLVVDLRLMRLVLRAQPLADIGRAARPWFNLSFAVMLVSGTLLFLSEAVKCFYNQPFWIKMGALLLATIHTYTLRRKTVADNEQHIGVAWRALTGIASIALWGSVAWGGRWIGFWG